MFKLNCTMKDPPSKPQTSDPKESFEEAGGSHGRGSVENQN